MPRERIINQRGPDRLYGVKSRAICQTVLFFLRLYYFLSDFIIFIHQIIGNLSDCYSTVTDLARLRGLSTSVPLANAV